MRAAVVVFPGSNCEHDVAHALAGYGVDADLVWHRDTDLSGCDGVVLPGVEGSATGTPHLHFERLTPMVQRNRLGIAHGCRKKQGTRGDPGAQQRELRCLALGDEAASRIDQHPFAVVREAAASQLGAFAGDACSGFDRIDVKAGEGRAHQRDVEADRGRTTLRAPRPRRACPPSPMHSLAFGSGRPSR